MTDYSELKRLAEAALRNWPDSKLFERPECESFIDSARPDVVMALIAEIESLRSQVGTLQSAANSWQSGYDEGRRIGTKTALDEREELRKDAERYRFLRQDISNNVQDFCIVKKRWSATFPDRILEMGGADAEIDAAMTKGGQP